MSQYLNIYLKHNNTYIPLIDYSRSTEIYSEFGAPFEKLREYSPSEIREVALRLDHKIQENIEGINKNQAGIELIPHFTGATIDDRLEAIASLRENISILKEENESLKFWMDNCYFLANISEDFEENSIWAGIEAYPEIETE